MGKVLVIAEKRIQAEQLSKPFPHKTYKTHIEVSPCETFPNGAVFVNAVGHVLELAQPADYDNKWEGSWSLEQLPIIPQQFRQKVSKKSAYKIISEYVKSDEIRVIYHAGDPEVEGQLIVDSLLDYIGNKKYVKRLWTTSLTKDAVLKAFQNLKDNRKYESLKNAALARQHSDWLLGMNFSRLMTVLLQQKGFKGKESTFSVGRVQSALIGIIYKREKAIETFMSEPYWDVFANFVIDNHTYQGKWFIPDEEHIFSQKQAKLLMELSDNKQAQVEEVKCSKKEIRPPQFYNLTTLQSEANKRLGLSPAQTLSILQSLYERGYCSYPRTDSRYVTSEEAKLFPRILANLSEIEEYQSYLPAPIQDISQDKRYVDASKTDDHYALMLTEERVNPNILNKNERIIYDMIAKSMIAAHYPNAVFDQTEIITLVDEKFTFKSNGKQVIENGWKIIYSNDNQEKGEDIILPHLGEGDSGNVKDLEITEGKTTPPSRFTQGDLVSIMANAAAYVPKDKKEDFTKKELALGTVATRAEIINKVTSMDYIRIEKNKVYLQSKGKVVVEALGVDGFFTSPVTTGKMEKYLADISNGKKSYAKYIEYIKQVIHKYIPLLVEQSASWDFKESIEKLEKEKHIGSCLFCGKPIVDKGSFYGCTGFRENGCRFSLPKEKSGKTLKLEHIQSILEKKTTSLIKGFKKKDKEDTFDAFVIWDDKSNKLAFSFEGIPKNNYKKLKLK